MAEGDNSFDCADFGDFDRGSSGVEDQSEIAEQIENNPFDCADLGDSERRLPGAQKEAGSEDVRVQTGEIVAKPQGALGVEELYRKTFGDWNS